MRILPQLADMVMYKEVALWQQLVDSSFSCCSVPVLHIVLALTKLEVKGPSKSKNK